MTVITRDKCPGAASGLAHYTWVDACGVFVCLPLWFWSTISFTFRCLQLSICTRVWCWHVFVNNAGAMFLANLIGHAFAFLPQFRARLFPKSTCLIRSIGAINTITIFVAISIIITITHVITISSPRLTTTFVFTFTSPSGSSPSSPSSSSSSSSAHLQLDSANANKKKSHMGKGKHLHLYIEVRTRPCTPLTHEGVHRNKGDWNNYMKTVQVHTLRRADVVWEHLRIYNCKWIWSL